ncbi:MauE/DoxX family redox-associated membrane protein [Notoacmeibacter sp. MSK16QG-6]|uniref:MauE/DoxX family redox-associated membrane protein n=1 Tax=Notoacmeibacter sp. MSK16QG-6 TaxID=2957982 RepID=UPI00209FE011|nr:MauE/DoxX family redox-associated membrane protein [Notoacmeibacter sp. MSK16QG-6]MCP1198929.1 glutaredoxin [Notoacmeibacter sp. MSK16QG-6]
MSTIDAKSYPYEASAAKKAVLYRMVMENHLCPFGLKSRYLLKSNGYEVEDHHLQTKAQTDAFRQTHDVKTTPQTFIDGERIGGHDDLRRYFGKHVAEKGETTYEPVIAIFGMTGLMALALVYNLYTGYALADGWGVLATLVKWFLAFSMCGLAIQKLQDVEGFSNGFLGYDLLAQRWVPYAYVYPYAEAFAGIGMIALVGSGSPLIWPVGLVSLFIGTVGAISVFKAVYIDKRELKCACVGGDSNVPLGFISLTENIMMIVMGLWMIATLLV